jgi:hypothetical protein
MAKCSIIVKEITADHLRRFYDALENEETPFSLIITNGHKGKRTMWLKADVNDMPYFKQLIESCKVYEVRA